ncbi:MAG TPA: aldehyde dehydrogenase family protein [Trebonia sp.]
MTSIQPAFRHHLDKQLIGGAWRDGGGDKRLADTNPFDGSPVADFRVASTEDVDAAYTAARDAQPGWEAVNAYAKRTVFERAVRYIEDNTDEITSLIVEELGGTRLKAAFEIGLVVDIIKEAATFPLRIQGRILPSPLADKENRVYQVPVGVVGVISPFNFPFFLSMKSVAPALAAGNGVVLKPHEDTPITGGTLIGRIFEEAGLPAGLLNVVVTEIAAIGDAFISHPVPRVLSFTGSTAVGRHIAEVAAREFKKPVLGLGGNSALVVLADADLDLAVDAAVFSRFTHQGQICMSANRVLVHADIYDEFASRYVARVAALKVGDPAAPDTVIGPLINARQAANLDATVTRAIADGARPLLRGTLSGNLFPPVILTDVTGEMAIAGEELFGPVVCLMRFDTEEQALALVNNTPFGLSGAVHTRDIERGVAFAQQIDSGMIHVNDATIHDEPIVAFGGVKQSGLSRLNGESSLAEFTTLKWISINRGRRVFPY